MKNEAKHNEQPDMMNENNKILDPGVRRLCACAPRRCPLLIAHCSLLVATILMLACRNDMYDQPSKRTYEESQFFVDGASARRPVANTIARGELRTDAAFWRGTSGTLLLQRMPMAPTREMLQRGRERFNIYCTPCHGFNGDGNGIIIQRGFGPPPSYHIGRLRAAPDGHLYDVITNGYGTMYSYDSRVEAADRWAVAAYIRALQLSRHAKPGDLTPDDRAKLGSESGPK